MPDAREKVAVFGIGSLLMGDDGIGPWAIRRLEARLVFPPEVRVADLGTPGPELVESLIGLEALIVIDSVHADAEPGEVLFLRRPEILRTPREDCPLAHQPRLRDALISADLHGDGPKEVLLIGVVPHHVELSTELSRRVRRALPRIELEVVEELVRLGHPAQPLDVLVEAATWSRIGCG